MIIVKDQQYELSVWRLFSGSGLLSGVIAMSDVQIINVALGLTASGLFLTGLYVYFNNQKLMKVTVNLRFKNYHGLYVTRAMRSDKIADPRTDHIYTVYFTLSTVVDNVIQTDNITTFPDGLDGKCKELVAGIKERELSSDWIGWTGEERESNIWRNTFNTELKRRFGYHGYSISVIACAFVRQEPK